MPVHYITTGLFGRARGDHARVMRQHVAWEEGWNEVGTWLRRLAS